MTDLDYGSFEALTFDCYGTLIDWDTGILAGIRPVLAKRGLAPPDDEIVKVYTGFEAAAEAGPYVPYRAILARCLREVAGHYGVKPDDREASSFGDSVGDWPAFPDSSAALRRLGKRFRLGVITNCDDDLFARSAARLGVDFEWVVTAQQVGSYKPDTRNFGAAFERLGLPRDRILHVAQGIIHDHVPAKRLGLSTVWIDRHHDRPGRRITPPEGTEPDATFPDMASFAEAATVAS